MTDILMARPDHLTEVALLLNEYFRALEVVMQDSAEEIAASLADPTHACWLAFVDGVPAGCVALRPLEISAVASGTARECKRLYVRPRFRGQNIARAMLDAMEIHAVQAGAEWIYLDSKDDLKSALRIYGQRAYEACPRYNDNPQATVFMRKRL